MVYKNLILNLLNERKINISANLIPHLINYIEKMYKEYLDVLLYANLELEKEKSKAVINFKLDVLLSNSEEQIKKIILEDQNYMEFLNVTNEIFKKAVYKKIKNNNYFISVKEAKTYNEKLIKLFSNVDIINKSDAKIILSETLLDLNFLLDGNMNSLRLNKF